MGFMSTNMPLLSGLAVLSLTSFQHVLASKSTDQNPIENTPSCQWGPLVAKHPICTPTSPSASPFSKTREEWRALGWDGPNDCLPTNPDYCIYAKIPDPPAKLSDGSSFIVISTAKSMSAIASTTPPSIGGQQPISTSDFYPQEIPGKGTGLIANRTIKKGEMIMRHTPTLLIQFDMPEIDAKPGAMNGANELHHAERAIMYGNAVKRMDEARKKRFLRQVGEDIVEIVDKNSFRLFVDGDEGHIGFNFLPDLGREIKGQRADMVQSTHYRIQNLTHITVAVRDVLPGEELTVSYIEGTIPYSERQERLDSWGFKCACHACSQDLSQISQSDARVKAIADIEAELEAKMRSGEDFSKDIGDRLVDLYVEERLDNYIAHAYTKAALLKSMIGDGDAAKKYARLAVEALVREYGPDTKDEVAMRELAEKTEEHWSWGIRMGGWAM